MPAGYAGSFCTARGARRAGPTDDHASNTRSASAEVRVRAVARDDCPGAGHRQGLGGQLRGGGAGGRGLRGARARARRRGAARAAAPAALRARRLRGAGIGPRAPGAAPQGRDAAAAVGGVPRRLRAGAAGVQPHALQRAVRGVRRDAAPLDAPGAQGGREAVRGLRRPDGGGDRRGHRRDPGGERVRCGVGRVELHVCVRHGHAAAGRLDRRARGGARVLRRRPGAAGARQRAGADHQARPLRTRGAPGLRGDGRALRLRGAAGAPPKAARQAGRGSRRAVGQPLDPGAAARSALL